MNRLSGKMILALLGVVGVGAYFYEKNKTAALAAPSGPSAPPLPPPPSPGGGFVNPASLPYNADYQSDTFDSAVALDQMLIANGPPTSKNATVTAFQQNVVLDPASASFAADHAPFIDGLYGPNTATALAMVLGTTNIVQPVIA